MKIIGGDLPHAGNRLGRPPLSDSCATFPAQEAGKSLWVDSGRSALRLALLNLRARGARGAWLPFLCCSSVVEPFLDLGFSLRFYGQGREDGATAPFWLAPPVGLSPRRGEVLLFIHYFGFLNEGMTSVLDRLPPQVRPWIIEDAVPASLTEGAGRWGDFTLRSFRKFLPVADGALITAKEAFPIGKERLEEPDARRFRLKGWSALGRLLFPGGGRRWLQLAQEGEERFDGVPRRPSPRSLSQLKRIDRPGVVASRRRNFAALLEELGRRGLLGSIIDPFTLSLPEGVAPLGLPLRLRKGSRDETLRRLRRDGIFSPADWGVNALSREALDADREMARRLLVLPVDQALEDDDIAFIAERLEGAAKRRDARHSPRITPLCLENPAG